MPKSLFIVRNPDSPLLKYIDIKGENNETLLIQNAVYSEELRKKDKVKILKDDAELRDIDAEKEAIDYDEMLKLIFSNEKVICL